MAASTTGRDIGSHGQEVRATTAQQVLSVGQPIGFQVDENGTRARPAQQCRCGAPVSDALALGSGSGDDRDAFVEFAVGGHCYS
jgi:hypothetical protein